MTVIFYVLLGWAALQVIAPLIGRFCSMSSEPTRDDDRHPMVR